MSSVGGMVWWWRHIDGVLVSYYVQVKTDPFSSMKTGQF